MLAVVRYSEPYVKESFKAEVRKVFRCKQSKKSKSKKIKVKNSFLKDGLDQFTHSAMNIEYVYLILMGINTCMQEKHQQSSHQQLINSRSDNETKKIKIDKKPGRTKITFSQIKFEDVHDWDVLREREESTVVGIS